MTYITLYFVNIMLNTLKQTYCRLGVSSIQGIGVIAIQDIPIGVNPFIYPDGKLSLEYNIVYITEEELEELPDTVQKLVKDFIIKTADDTYPIPENGMNSLDITFYMNHSKTPNVEIVFDEGCKYTTYRALRRIKCGEELTIDYRVYYKYAAGP